MPQFLRSELPVRAVTRQHWVVLFRRVRRSTLVTFLLLLVATLIWHAVALAFIVVVVGFALWRWLLWRNERIYLTGKRIVRMDGIPAVTRHEAWLRVDRISGAQFDETWLGRRLDYATIDLEAPGEHPGIRRLIRVGRASPFYLAMRDTVFGETWGPDPDEAPPPGRATDYVTEPLPQLDLARPQAPRRYRRRD